MTGLVEVSAASDYCQRWSGRVDKWRHESDPFDPGRYTVAPVDAKTAKDYVLANHYAGAYSSAKRRFGLYEHETLVGVAVFALPMRDEVLTNVFPDLEPTVESLELSRLVLADRVPGNGESWFLGQIWHELVAGGVRGVVSFSDPVPRWLDGRLVFPGHVGTIYQASNAVFCGRSKPRWLTILPDRTVLSDRSAAKVVAQDRGHAYVERHLVALGARPLHAGERPAAWLAEALDAVRAERLHHGGNLRYAFPLGPRTRRPKVAMPAMPYVKRWQIDPPDLFAREESPA